MTRKTIEAGDVKSLGQREKWKLLSPFLKQHGREALSYATLQAGMEYFVHEHGYIAYTTVRHPVFARNSKKIAFADPVCSMRDYPKVIQAFLDVHPDAVFSCISDACAQVLR